ncbi:hypothetical protein [Chromobacterium phragmitis]|nr:hypothetical protein [Chromobacterium phragmitis]
MSKYKIMQFAGKSKGNTPVTSFEDMARHHPDSGHEKKRHYEEIHGKDEEVSISSNRKNIKKDFILSDEKNSRNVYVPSPVSGYATYGKNYGTILIYDKEKGKDRVLLAKLHHVKPETTTFKNGTKVEYGQGLGVQYGTGENGKKEYDVHSHVETDEETYKKYISDIVSGKINLSAPAQEKKPTKKENQDKKQEKPNTPPTPTSTPTSNTQPAKKMGGALGNLIAKGEGSYGSYNRGSAGDSLGKTINFSAMSISEVQKRQNLPVGDKNRLFAIGKYQIIPTTMADAVKKLKLTGNEKLTPELQEKIFSEYLIAKKRPQVKNFITGKETSPAKAQTALAAEWASVADPKTGLSRYGKVGHNKASISASSTKEALTKMKEEYATNIKNGMSPEQAWQKVNGLDLIGQPQKNSNDSSQDKEEPISGKKTKQHADAEAAKQKAAEQAKAKQRADAEAAKQKAAEQAKAKQRADAEAAKQKAAEQAKAKQRADAEAVKQKAAEQAKAKQRADAEAAKQKAAEQAKTKQRADAEAAKQKAAEQAKAKQHVDAEAVKQKAAEQAKAKQHVDAEAVKQKETEQAQTKIEAARKKEPVQPKQQATAKPTQKQPAQAKPTQPASPGNLDAQLAQLASLIGQLNAALAPLAKPIQITVDVQNGNIVAAVNAANSQQQRRS